MQKLISSILIITFFISTIDRANSSENAIAQKLIFQKIQKEMSKNISQGSDLGKELIHSGNESLTNLDKLTETQFSTAMKNAVQRINNSEEIELLSKNINEKLSSNELKLLENSDQELCWALDNCSQDLIKKAIIKRNLSISLKIKNITKEEFKFAIKSNLEKAKFGDSPALIVLFVFIAVLIIAGLIALTIYFPASWYLIWTLGAGGGGTGDYFLVNALHRPAVTINAPNNF